MIALSLATLFAIVAISTAIALTDCWLRGRLAYTRLNRERALADAGFVPMVETSDIRLRGRVRVAPAATRPFARRLPQGLPAPLPARAPGAA